MTFRVLACLAAVLPSVFFTGCTSLSTESGPQPQANLMALAVNGEDIPESEGQRDFARVGLTLSTTYFLPSSALQDLPNKLHLARESLVSTPLAPDAFKVLAYDALSRVNPDGALVYLNTAPDERNGEWALLSGIAHLMRGDNDEGLALLEQSSQLGAVEGLGDFNSGVFHYVHGNAATALAHFNKAIDASPKNATVRLFAGAAAFTLKDYAQAERHLVVAAHGRQERSVARYNLGLLYRSGFRDMVLARQVFRALMDDPDTQEQIRVLALAALENMERDRHGMPELAMVTSLTQ